ncbi:MAG: N-6 DNA methylase [Geobacter sp.]|nr:N-6 DNA methylase [Geobacter sp.]
MSHNIVQKKKIGAFYTPQQVSRILCDWAIRSPNDRILEPSFGGCGFLEASRDCLINLGCNNPNIQLYGCDLDQTAFHHLADRLGPTNITGHFLLTDFLQLRKDAFVEAEFDVIIGNPPYISHHNMPLAQKKNAYAAMISDRFSVSAKASLWAYFIIHSLQFLKRNGRMAWVLPGSFLYANYAAEIRDHLRSVFGRILVVSVNERLFISEGAEESSVIVLCEDFETGPAQNNIEVCCAEHIDDISQVVRSWQGNTLTTNCFNNRIGISILGKAVNDIYLQLSESSNCIKLGDITNILIGIVTGDNKFFVINQSAAVKNALETDSVRCILPKYNIVSGLSLLESDLTKAREQDVKCLLVNTAKSNEDSKAIIDYLTTYPDNKKINNKTFAKRQIWHRPDDGRIPDAFLSYMHHYGPRLALNDAQITCTNTIHRVFFKEELPLQRRKLIAISLLTTFSQLSAEFEGRSYGSGVLKHEPSEAKKIAIRLPHDLSDSTIDASFRQIDELLRISDLDGARRKADLLIFKPIMKEKFRDLIETLGNALTDARRRRHRHH